jgi:hypothetical protein
MKHQIRIMAFALAIAAPLGAAFAQDAATTACADYAAMDNAGQMEMLAEIESMNSGMASNQELTSAEIHEQLSTECTANPDALVTDAWKKVRGM